MHVVGVGRADPGPVGPSAGASAVLRILVASGVPLPLDALPAVGVLRDVAVGTALDELDRAGLVEWLHDGRFVAAPPGTACALRPIDRARLRGEVGRAVRQAPSMPGGLVARLLLDGASVDPDPTVLEDLVAHAAELQLSGRTAEAVDVLVEVTDALDRGQQAALLVRVQALTRLAFLLRFSGRGEQAASLTARAMAAARASGDRHALAATALAWRPESIGVSDDPAALAVIDELLADDGLADAVPGLRARLFAARAEALVFADLDAAQQAATHGLQAARATDDAEAFVVAAYAYRVTHWHPSRQAEALALGSEMVAVAPRLVDHREFGACTRLQVFFELGDWAHFDGELSAMARRLAAAPGPLELLWLRVMLAARAQSKGHWDEADRLIAAALELAGGPEHGHAVQLLGTQQLLAAWHRGEDLTPLGTADVAPAGPMAAGWEAALLGWTCTRRDRADVVATLDRLLLHGFASIRPDLTSGPVSAFLAMAAAEARSTPHARLLYDGLRPHAEQWAGTGGAVLVGAFALHLGRLAAVLGRPDEAQELLLAANAAARAGGCRVWLARGELALAQLHAARGRSSTVRRHARTAHALADELGMTEVATAAGRLYGRAQRPAGLTAREADVLRLLPAGPTNTDIAARLHLSVKTVERHLLNAYRKAGVRNRAEAAAFASRELGD